MDTPCNHGKLALLVVLNAYHFNLQCTANAHIFRLLIWEKRLPLPSVFWYRLVVCVGTSFILLEDLTRQKLTPGSWWSYFFVACGFHDQAGNVIGQTNLRKCIEIFRFFKFGLNNDWTLSLICCTHLLIYLLSVNF